MRCKCVVFTQSPTISKVQYGTFQMNGWMDEWLNGMVWYDCEYNLQMK